MSEFLRRVKKLENGTGDGTLEYVVMFRDTSGIFRNNAGEIFLPEREEGMWRSTTDDHLVQGWIIMREELRGRI
jgi:hypothetical protein